jgi:hypothetical protein
MHAIRLAVLVSIVQRAASRSNSHPGAQRGPSLRNRDRQRLIVNKIRTSKIEIPDETI